MPLTLEVVGHKAAQMGSAARKVFTAGGTIGRLHGNDWIFPDEYISGHHARISFANGSFLIEDTSTNGVFINSPQNRLVRGKPYALRNGDTVFIDDYEVRVTLSHASASIVAGSQPFGSSSMFPEDPFGSRVDSGDQNEMDPLSLLGLEAAPAILPGPSSASLARNSPLSQHYQPPRVPAPQPAPVFAPPLQEGMIPDDYDPFGPDDPPDPAPGPAYGASQSANPSFYNVPPDAHARAAFGSGGPQGSGVPLGPDMSPRQSAPLGAGMPPGLSAPPGQSALPRQNAPPAQSAPPRQSAPLGSSASPGAPRNTGSTSAEPSRVRIPNPGGPGALRSGLAPGSGRAPGSGLAPGLGLAPGAGAGLRSGAQGGAVAPGGGATPSGGVAAARAARNTPAAITAREPLKPVGDRRRTGDRRSAGNEGGLDFAALLTAAGIDPSRVTPELSAQFGQIMRVVVSGLMEVLRSRERIKDEFRMRMTTFKQVDNNPLKFSANVEDALHNLLVKRNAAFLGPVEAFEDAFEDVKNHQMAMLAGMRVAYDTMLAGFEPKRLQEEFDRTLKAGSFLSGPAKLKYWELYRNRFRDMVKDADSSFRDLFGNEFAKAYEEQLARLKTSSGADRK